MYTVLLLGFLGLVMTILDVSPASSRYGLANYLDAAGFMLIVTLAAPLFSLILSPILAATAVMACLVTSHVLGNNPEWSLKLRRLVATGCGALTGITLWAVSTGVGGADLSLYGGIWLIAAILAMLTLNAFLFSEGRRRGYRNG